MNERIRELAEQATTEEADGFKYFDKEKFAELIVRECCQFEKSYGGDAGLIARDYSRKIKEHFGVEQ
jgi:hypothetical protein